MEPINPHIDASMKAAAAGDLDGAFRHLDAMAAAAEARFTRRQRFSRWLLSIPRWRPLAHMTARRFVVSTLITAGIASLPSLALVLEVVPLGTPAAQKLVELRTLVFALAAAFVALLAQARNRFLSVAIGLAATVRFCAQDAGNAMLVGKTPADRNWTPCANALRARLDSLYADIETSRLGLDEWLVRLARASRGIPSTTYNASKVGGAFSDRTRAMFGDSATQTMKLLTDLYRLLLS